MNCFRFSISDSEKNVPLYKITYAKSQLYLKNLPTRIIFEKINFVKKGSPKKFSTQLFFMWTRNHLKVLMRKNTLKIEKISLSIFYYFISVKKIFGQNKKKIIKNIYDTFFYFSRIFSHQHVQIITGPHKKSSVEKNFGDPLLTKFIFSKIMRVGQFLRWRAQILHTWSSHIETHFFHYARSKKAHFEVLIVCRYKEFHCIERRNYLLCRCGTDALCPVWVGIDPGPYSKWGSHVCAL